MTGRKNNRKRLVPGKNSRNKSKKKDKDKDINALAISDSIADSKADNGGDSDFKKICDEICSRIANGESLVKICRDAHIPDKATIFNWLKKAQEVEADRELTMFFDNYALAREAQADALVDEILDIADGPAPPIPGVIQKNAEPIQPFDALHAKLKIEARKWIAGRQKPKKYGDRLELVGDEKNPLSHKNVELTSDELNKELVKRGLPTVILEK